MGERNGASLQSENLNPVSLTTPATIPYHTCYYSLPRVLIVLQQFQELEEQRIAYLRHQMWTLCNLCSQTTVYEDQVGDVMMM